MDLQLDFCADWTAIQRAELVRIGYAVPANTTPKKLSLLFFNALFRRVPQRPRRVLKSRELQCPPELQAGLTWLEQRVINGDDLNPHLSRKTPTLDYDDALLNDWGIYHFHLGTTFLPNGLIQGTDPVLFARVTENDFYAICTGTHHNGWADLNWIEILHSNWPDSIKNHKLPGELMHGTDANTIKAMRKAKINAPVETQDGTIYRQLGGGYATDGTSLRVVMNANTHATDIKGLEKWVRKNIGLLVEKLKTVGYTDDQPLNAKFEVDSEGWYASFPTWNYRFKLRANLN